MRRWPSGLHLVVRSLSCFFCYDSSSYLIFNGMYSDVYPQA
jgi:hypothetical protein